MHELAVAQRLVDRAVETVRDHDASRVRAMRIALGPDDHLTPEALAFSVEAACRGTLAEGANIQITHMATSGVRLCDVDIEEPA